jgi:gluconate 2-dehydrogenase gamma chain
LDNPLQDEVTRITRRRLLAGAGSLAAATGLLGLSGCGESETQAEQAAASAADVDAPQLDFSEIVASQAPINCSVLSFFTREEAGTVDAFTARLIPGDGKDPGAREACVMHFIDRKLAEYDTFATPTYFKGPFAEPAKGRKPGFHGDTVYVAEEDLERYGFQSSLTPQQAYRLGLRELERYSQQTHGLPFAALPDSTQDTIIGLLEDDKLESFEKPSGGAFFDMLLEDTYEGMFADPLYGGNRNYVGWRLIGYLGAQRAWTPEELKHGPRERRIQGLRDMAPMHPGRIEPHVILPIRGTTGPHS